jgi:integrase/recombinase XerD
MSTELVSIPPTSLSPSAVLSCTLPIPQPISRAGASASRRYLEFFTANIRNPNTRDAYNVACSRFFSWCDQYGWTLDQLEPMHFAAYVELLGVTLATPSVKQHLAAIRALFDWLVVGQVVRFNPATSVRGPRYSTKRGKTPVLSTEEARALLESISIDSIVGLRDRALIATMLFTFARISACLNMKTGDYYQQGRRAWFRLHEKGGKNHTVPAHHKVEIYVDEYLEAARVNPERREHASFPLFRVVNRNRELTERPLLRRDALSMVKRRASAADLPYSTCCHSFRASGITAYLTAGGTLESAQRIAAHASPRTTMLYDHTGDEISLSEIERINI